MDRDQMTNEAARAHQDRLMREARRYAREYYRRTSSFRNYIGWLLLFIAMTICSGIVAAIILMNFY